MMKVYSDDLRRKVFNAWQDKQGSMRTLCERFTVSLSFVFKLIKGFRQNGHIRPKPHGGGRPASVNEEGRKFLTGLICRKPDLTLTELCEHYESDFGIKISKSAMDRTLKKMNTTRKKNSVRSRKTQRSGDTAYSRIFRQT
jgi:putative transposase